MVKGCIFECLSDLAVQCDQGGIAFFVVLYQLSFTEKIKSNIVQLLYNEHLTWNLFFVL